MRRNRNVLLIEDHPLMRNGIRSLISDHGEFKVAAEAGSLAEARKLTLQSDLAMILLDISLPDGSGLDLIPHLRSVYPNAKIVVLTMHNEAPYMATAIQRGAEGFVVKDMAPERLVFTMKTVMEGQQCFLSTKPVAPSESGKPRAAVEKHQALSAREENVMRLLVDGNSLTEIAEQLDLSVKTVFTYRVRLLKKLGLKNNAELIKAQINALARRESKADRS